MATTPTTAVAVMEPEFSDHERYALAAFLAGYRGLTRDAYATGPAPVRRLVRGARPAAVRCATGRHRVLRP